MADHRILLIEDDDDVADAMSVLLEGQGYAVVRVVDGEAALRALREGLAPCLIVLDLFMPGMSGVEFRRVQRAEKAIAGIPVIVVSGVANMVKEVAAMGVARCFTKPVDFQALLGVVNEFCPA